MHPQYYTNYWTSNILRNGAGRNSRDYCSLSVQCRAARYVSLLATSRFAHVKFLIFLAWRLRVLMWSLRHRLTNSIFLAGPPYPAHCATTLRLTSMPTVFPAGKTLYKVRTWICLHHEKKDFPLVQQIYKVGIPSLQQMLMYGG
jgi:hypothetical protein